VEKIISLRPIPRTVVRSNLRHAWRFLDSLCIEDIEDNWFIFTFQAPTDMNRVIEHAPWNIRGHPMFLNNWEADSTLEEVSFDNGTFWVQIHDDLKC
jgi:hypothetical protein